QQRLQMEPGAGQSDDKVVAALLTAVDRYEGSIELTGSDAFKAKAIGLIVRHRIDVTMKTPEQQAILNAARLDDIVNTPVLDHERRVSAELGRFAAEVERAASKPADKAATLDLEAGFAAIRARRDGVRETQDAMRRRDEERVRIEQEKQAEAQREEQRRINAWNQQRRDEEARRQQLEAARQPKWKPPSPG
uniref:LPD7 domain-containing protein n=1 Tax=Pseudomonas ovata TaxID=1839709 RepID=UPI0030C826E9